MNRHRVRKAITVLLCGLLISIVLPAAAPAQTPERNTYQRLCGVGKERLKQGDFRGAQDAFEQALRYYDADAEAYLGLGAAYAHQKDVPAAERAFQRALERNPRERRALMALGDLAQKRDDLETAARWWEQALEIEPGDAVLRAKLDRIRREQGTERDFNHEFASHFSVKYEGRERIEAGRIVLRILEEAYGEVGRALSHYPDHDVAVILYSDQQFRDVTNAPGWSGGIYDGKIRIPIGGIDRETPQLRKILYHEYTHAAVRAITARVPTWLNEGLAQYFDGTVVEGRQREMLQRLQQAGKLPPLKALEGSFMGLGGNDAALAYLISAAVVRSLVDQFGMYRVKMMLEEYAAGADSSRAASAAFMLSADELDRSWKRVLE